MSSVLFFVMSVNEKNALAEENLNTRITLPRGIRKNSFPRDSSASLGMTGNKMLGMTHSFNCHVELVETSRGSVAKITIPPNPRGGKLKRKNHPVAGN